MEFKNKIVNGDCLDVLRELPKRCVDLIITSPPYNVGMDYGEYYNDKKFVGEYLDFLRERFEACYDVLKLSGRICVNIFDGYWSERQRAPNHSYVTVMLSDIGFKFRDTIIWDQLVSQGTAWGSWLSPSNPYLQNPHEYVLIFGRENIPHQGDKITITRKEFVSWTKSSIWQFQPEYSRQIRAVCPAPFPIELPRRLIKLYSYQGDLVVDPFCGSGTTCVAAKKSGRDWLGIDINPEYCKFAEKRVKNTSTFTNVERWLE